ncbi:MAG: tol-pal system-associated acyl-CoA thioesterase [Methylobacteriaceae bacterium]|jgi:acyl-CoA thioester hydrolase|nr:tol-pal system-associated acyl-CoA thioesterase [Methylobacteriaceae bacterium]
MTDTASDLAPIGGTVENGVHRLKLRVYYEDTDFSGIVYHANYLRFLERGRTDFLRLAGIRQSDLFAGGDGVVFAVRAISVNYIKPALMDDLLSVTTRVSEVSGASFVMDQAIWRADTLLLSAMVTIVSLKNSRPVRLPETVKQALSGG